MTPEVLWDNLSVETCLNGSAITGGCTHQTPTVAEIMETMHRVRLQVEESQNRLGLFVMTMEPCGLCGHKARYIKPPRERIQFCRCRVAELSRQSASVPGYQPDRFSPFSQFMGIEIEAVG
jgi:hypothetical protein